MIVQNKLYWHRVSAIGLPTNFVYGTLMEAQAYAVRQDVEHKRLGTMEVHGSVPMPSWEVSKIGENQLRRSGVILGQRF